MPKARDRVQHVTMGKGHVTDVHEDVITVKFISGTVQIFRWSESLYQLSRSRKVVGRFVSGRGR